MSAIACFRQSWNLPNDLASSELFGPEFRVVTLNNEVPYGHEDISGWSGRLHAQRVLRKKGKVVKVTPSGVEVHDGVELLQFDIYGKGCDGHKTYECGPWEIDDEMPVAERTALWEPTREARKTGP
jgi:hypothetical protein